MDNKAHFIGFSRIATEYFPATTEYLPAGANQWRSKPLDYNEELSVYISTPPTNIISMGKEQ